MNEKLIKQRDRFLAFAFAASDVLIETDAHGMITFCAGHCQPYFGVNEDKLVGQPVTDLVVLPHRDLVNRHLDRARQCGRMERISVRLRAGQGDNATVLLSGLCLPSSPGAVFLTVATMPKASRNPPPDWNAAKGVDGLAQTAMKKVEQGEGDGLMLTMVDLSASEALKDMTPEDQSAFIDSVGNCIAAWSLDGESAGQMGENRLGFLHDEACDPALVNRSIMNIAQAFGVDDLPAGSLVSTMTIEPEAMDPEDVSRALVYAMNKFVAEGGEAFAIQSLSEANNLVVDDILAKVQLLRQTLSSDALRLVFQPIVDLIHWEVHHYEALARIAQDDKLILPARFIGFSEEIGLAHELDMAVLKKAIYGLENNAGLRPKDQIAVNLSGRSLTNDAFVEDMIALLGANQALLPRLTFEVTESAAIADLQRVNTILQRIRKLGCPVSIDDFGSGNAAFHYVKELEVDLIKIDGSYIREAFDERRGLPFLKAMARLATDMKIATVGEMVEDSKTMWLLRDVGVTYGQGYYFGKPMADVSDFNLRPAPERPAGLPTVSKPTAAPAPAAPAPAKPVAPQGRVVAGRIGSTQVAAKPAAVARPKAPAGAKP